MLLKNALYYGRTDPLPESVPLRAGPLSLLFEAGDLRTIKLGDREILRRVYVAIRDHNWGTVPPTLTNTRIEAADDSFRITFDVENLQGEIDFAWQGTITGDAQGTIRYRMDGVARSTFRRNRVGFCILHPVRECAGQPCRVEQVDGSTLEASFPQQISPHQPFFDMRAISHDVLPGVRAEVRFEGDTFEMEDQRNWTDASFKTYCTPLALPFPVEVKQGTRIAQTVTLTLRGELPGGTPTSTPDELTLSIDATPIGPLPRIGLGTASHGAPLSDLELARLRVLHLSHLRVDLDLSKPAPAAKLRQATAEAVALGAQLEVALHLSDAAVEELASFVDLLSQLKPPVCTWLIFHQAEKSTSARWIKLARRYLSGYDARAKLGSGTDAFFTELNRERPPAELLDLVTYSLNPQVHAFDNRSLVETLEAQAATVDSARNFCQDKPLAISTITSKMRFNPNATGPDPVPSPGELPPQVDPRQASLFGAGWTVGSLKQVAESGVYSATYYETSGWLGVMERADGSPLPDRFPSLPGAVFPIYHVVADVGEFASGEVIATRSSDPLRLQGLALRQEGATRVLLANLSPEPLRVTLGPLGAGVQVRVLDERNAEQAMLSPEAYRGQPAEPLATSAGQLVIDLLPYAIVRIDS